MHERDGEREHRWFLRAVYVALAVAGLVVLWGRIRQRPSAPGDEGLQSSGIFDGYWGPPPLPPLTVNPSAPRLIRWCAVRGVLERKCQRCHGEPRAYGAPFPLLTYADVLRDYPAESGRPIVERMAHAIRNRVMPPTTLELDPPVAPLDEREKDTLLAWLEEGAWAFGGETCDP